MAQMPDPGDAVAPAPEAERRRVARLFHRAAFGASTAEIDRWAARGYAAAVDHLLGFPPAATRPDDAEVRAREEAAPVTPAPGSDLDHAATARNHPRLLAELDVAVDRFAAEAAAHGHAGDYLLMTFSEFGRRIAEDGAAGTDHGTAAPLFVVGDAVAGGLYGEHPRLDPGGVDDDGNMIRTVDFREVYATVLDGWFRGPPATEVLGTTAADGLRPVPFLR